MNIVNNLGSYETLEQVWKSYPEGGKDGDYLYIGDELRYWNKYSYSWVASDIPESSLIKPIEVTYAEGVIDYSEGYINYIGSFDGFEQVWDMYPNGGKDGDYILVAGERYKWNKHISNWGEIDLSDVTPARPIATVYGDLHVHNDAVIGENLYARILETFTTKKWVLEQGYISLNDITSDVVMARILTDNETITKRNGRLVVIGGTGSGGGTADSVAWENITGKPYWIGDEKPQYTLAEITGSDGDGFVTIKGDQAIEGVKDFAYGAKFGGALLRYDTSKKCWIFPNNVLVEGGIAWNSSIDGFDPHTITDAVEVDWKTIGKDENGALYVIGGAGDGSGSVEGGVAMSDVQQYVTSVLTNYAKKGATLSAYGITDAYTKNEADAKFVDFTTDNQQITGLKNFVNGLRIGGLPITAPLDDVVYIDANVVIRGGVAWNSSIEGFKPQTILDAVTVDEITISKKNGYLEFIGTIDGGVADNVAWDGITGKPTDINGYGITDAYTKVQIDDALAKKWTRNDQSISNWSAAYSWGNHAGKYLPVSGKAADSALLDGQGLVDANGRNGIPVVSSDGYTDMGKAIDFHHDTSGVDYSVRLLSQGNNKNKVYLPTATGTLALTDDIANALLTYVTLATNQDIAGIKNFINGFKIGGKSVTYNAEKNALVFPLNAIFEGEVAWNSTPEGFKVPTIMDAIQVDGDTISKEGNVLKFVGKIDSGIDESQLAQYLTNNSYATQSWVTGRGYITGINGSMVTAALGYTPYNSANFTKATIKSTLGISDWALASVKPSYSWSEIGSRPTALSQFSNDSGFITNNVTGDFASFNSRLESNAIYEYKAGDGLSYAGDPVGSGYGVLMNIRDYRGYDGFQFLSTAASAWNKTDYRLLYRGKARSTSMDMSNGWREIPLMDMSGNLVVKGEIVWNSSRVLKNIVNDEPTYLSMEDMLKIKPYRYTWKDGRDDKIHAGGIADEVLEVLPEVIITDSEGIHSMDYGQASFTVATSLTPHVNRHNEEIDALKRRVKELEDLVTKLLNKYGDL